jgi:transposase
VGLGESCRWGIEGAWNLGRGLAQYLVEARAEVYEVNPRWTAEGRRRARKTEKSDRLDARAVALFVWREGASLPPVGADDDTATLQLLVTERDDLVAEATRLRNQLHQLLLQLDPGYREQIPSLTSRRGMLAALSYETDNPCPLQQERGSAVRRLARRMWLVVEQEQEIAHRIKQLATARFAPLTEICGISLLTAGALAGILGPGLRFQCDGQMAAYAGVAPLEASSAERVRHRLDRGGNRRLNAILYRIAITQARCSPEARAYLARRVAEGKTKREALRALKRFIVRAIWRRWRQCQIARTEDQARLAA